MALRIRRHAHESLSPRRFLGAETTGTRALMMPAFSPAISRHVSQPLFVIVTDRRDYRDNGLDGVGRIEPAAEAGLERDFDSRIPKCINASAVVISKNVGCGSQSRSDHGSSLDHPRLFLQRSFRH